MNHSIIIAHTLFSRMIRDAVQAPTTAAELLEMYPELKQRYPEYSNKGIGKVLTRLTREYAKQHKTVACFFTQGTNRFIAIGV